MTKQEQQLLEALCSGLPYGLKCNIIGLDNEIYEYVELTAASMKSSYESFCFVQDDSKGDVMPAEISMIHIENIKPIYRPWEEVNKLIVQNKKAISLFKELRVGSYKGSPNEVIEQFSFGNIEIKESKILSKYHFNVHNLPDTMVVYTDTLKDNPYE